MNEFEDYCYYDPETDTWQLVEAAGDLLEEFVINYLACWGEDTDQD